MGKFKRVLAAALAVVIGVIGVGCGSGNSSSDKSGSVSGGELKTVRIGTPGADATALAESAHAARQLGYIDEELEKVGYKAEYVPFGQGGTAVNEGLASEQIDYAFMGDAPEVIAKSNGLDVQLVASLNSEAVMGLFVGTNSGIESVKDMKGKKVVIAYGTVTHKHLVDILNENGLTIDDVNVINDIGNAAALVSSGEADALVLTGQGVYTFQANGIGKVIESTVDNPDGSAQFFAMARTKYLSENPETAKAINKALIRTKEYVESDYEGFLKLYATNEIPADVYSAIYPEEQGFDKLNPEITDAAKEKLKELSKFFVENQVITQDIDVDSFVNNTYYEEAVKELKENK